MGDVSIVHTARWVTTGEVYVFVDDQDPRCVSTVQTRPYYYIHTARVDEYRRVFNALPEVRWLYVPERHHDDEGPGR